MIIKSLLIFFIRRGMPSPLCLGQKGNTGLVKATESLKSCHIRIEGEFAIAHAEGRIGVPYGVDRGILFYNGLTIDFCHR